jgi:hypothetical protein
MVRCAQSRFASVVSHPLTPACSLHHPDHSALAPHLRLRVQAARSHPGLPPHNRTCVCFLRLCRRSSHSTYPTALPPPHNRFHVLHHMLQAVGSSNKRHNDPSVRTHPGVPFILVQRAWRFERRAIDWPRPSEDQISRSAACLCREPRTTCLGEQRVSSGCDISNDASTSVDTEDVGSFS